MQRLDSNYYDFFRVLEISCDMNQMPPEYLEWQTPKKREKQNDSAFVSLLREKIKKKEMRLCQSEREV
jgi:hypothetical protein